MRKNRESGFTLMEILIAVAVLAIGVVAVVNLFPVGLQAARRTANFSEAAVLAQRAMEFYRGEGYDEIHDLYTGHLPYPDGWKDPGTDDVYIPAPTDITELERGGGMEGAWPFDENPDYSRRIVISEHVDDVENFHLDPDIYKLTLFIYWLDRGQEQFDMFETLIAGYED